VKAVSCIKRVSQHYSFPRICVGS